MSSSLSLVAPSITTLGCLHLLPATQCSNGLCVTGNSSSSSSSLVSWCECEPGFLSITDMVGHENADCAIGTDSLRVIWAVCAFMGLIGVIAGIYKLVHSLEVSGPEAHGYNSKKKRSQQQATTPKNGTPNNGTGTPPNGANGNGAGPGGGQPSGRKIAASPSPSRRQSPMAPPSSLPLPPLTPPNGNNTTIAITTIPATSPTNTTALPFASPSHRQQTTSPIHASTNYQSLPAVPIPGSIPAITTANTAPIPMPPTTPMAAGTSSSTPWEPAASPHQISLRRLNNDSSDAINSSPKLATRGLDGHTTSRSSKRGTMTNMNVINVNAPSSGRYVVTIDGDNNNGASSSPRLIAPKTPSQNHHHTNTGRLTINGNNGNGLFGALNNSSGGSTGPSRDDDAMDAFVTTLPSSHQTGTTAPLIATAGGTVVGVGGSASIGLLAATAAVAALQPRDTVNYKAWMARASRLLSFRLSIGLIVMSVTMMIMGVTRAIHPDRAIGHTWDQTILFWICGATLSIQVGDFCLAWCNVYMTLSSFMPAAGVTPSRYGRQIFLGCSIFFQFVALVPLIIAGIQPQKYPHTAEVLTMIMWISIGAAIELLIMNFIILGRHLLVLLRSHLASMIMTEGMINGRAATSTAMIPAAASVRQRAVELEHSITRVATIVNVLISAAVFSAPLYVLVAAFPWLRGRLAYFIPAWLCILQPILITMNLTLKYTIRSVDSTRVVAMVANGGADGNGNAIKGPNYNGIPLSSPMNGYTNIGQRSPSAAWMSNNTTNNTMNGKTGSPKNSTYNMNKANATQPASSSVVVPFGNGGVTGIGAPPTTTRQRSSIGRSASSKRLLRQVSLHGLHGSGAITTVTGTHTNTNTNNTAISALDGDQSEVEGGSISGGEDGESKTMITTTSIVGAVPSLPDAFDHDHSTNHHHNVAVVVHHMPTVGEEHSGNGSGSGSDKGLAAHHRVANHSMTMAEPLLPAPSSQSSSTGVSPRTPTTPATPVTPLVLTSLPAVVKRGSSQHFFKDGMMLIPLHSPHDAPAPESDRLPGMPTSAGSRRGSNATTGGGITAAFGHPSASVSSASANGVTMTNMAPPPPTHHHQHSHSHHSTHSNGGMTLTPSPPSSVAPDGRSITPPPLMNINDTTPLFSSSQVSNDSSTMMVTPLEPSLPATTANVIAAIGAATNGHQHHRVAMTSFGAFSAARASSVSIAPVGDTHHHRHHSSNGGTISNNSAAPTTGHTNNGGDSSLDTSGDHLIPASHHHHHRVHSDSGHSNLDHSMGPPLT